MKLIMAVVKPSKLEEVRGVLSSFGVTGITVSEFEGFSRRGHTESKQGWILDELFARD